MDDTLKATRYLDFGHPSIRDFAMETAGSGNDVSKAVRLYYRLRDMIPYSLNSFGVREELFIASNVLEAASSFCVPKAILLAASARAVGVPARLGFANVRNHVTSPRVAELMDDDIFRWHAYTSLFLNGKWVKATPAFDQALCDRQGMEPLEFDGKHDSIFHSYGRDGRLRMEYIDYIGEFDDMPYITFVDDMRRAYPRMIEAFDPQGALQSAI